jgi:hypothetical protein
MRWLKLIKGCKCRVEEEEEEEEEVKCAMISGFRRKYLKL